MAKCDNCPNNCCGNNFVGLANAFKQEDLGECKEIISKL